MKGRKFLNVLKASRIYRTIPTILLIVFCVTYTKTINVNIILLGVIFLLIYSYAGIQNAIVDKDYKNLEKINHLKIILILVSSLISINNKFLFLANISWILIGITYNKISRKTILMDTTIMGISHYFMPLFFGFLILNLPIEENILISTTTYFLFWFITPSKNLKDIKEDKKRNYKTLATEFQNGKRITYWLLFLSQIFLIILIFITKINKLIFLIIPIIILLFIIAIEFFEKNKSKKALSIIRLTMIFIILSLTLFKSI